MPGRERHHGTQPFGHAAGGWPVDQGQRTPKARACVAGVWQLFFGEEEPQGHEPIVEPGADRARGVRACR